MDTSEIEHRARLLVEHIVDGIAKDLSTVTVAIYDTAWVSMISKSEEGASRWVFPECFEFLLEQQLPNGGWEAYAVKEDGILNTLAALLAMKRHERSIDSVFMLKDRIQNAIAYLQSSLHEWDVNTSMHVGFEILVPALLAMLEDEDIQLSFPGRASLLALNKVKLKSFRPHILYGTEKTTLLHSLEAFIGKIDFDQVGHHKTSGSMMASPAATAAYLMNISTWDEEAELYLRKVIRDGAGKGNGAVPSVFPTPIFESSWVVSTLLQGGYSIECLGNENVESIASYLEQHYRAQGGLLGFAPSIQADADDSARAILTLNLIGRRAHLKAVAEHFKSKDGHFHTFLCERDASFSANCNVLKALLETPDVHEYINEVVSILTFLCDAWWRGASRDKWNISPQYSMMLLTEAVMRVLELWDQGQMSMPRDSLLLDWVPVTLIQILNRTLMVQNPDGSWGLNQSPENTAYAVLTLKAISSLPWVDDFTEVILSAIQKGQHFLSECRGVWSKTQYLWVEKVTYGSPLLSEAYCLAATNGTTRSYIWSKSIKNLVQIPEKAAAEISDLFCSLHVFHAAPSWKIRACVLEGLLFVSQLRSARANILPGQQTAKNEYLNFIPCTWIVVNNIQNLFLDAYLLWDMMVLTLCNFRVDEYMETTMVQLSAPDLDEVGSTIRTLCEQENIEPIKPPHHVESHHPAGISTIPTLDSHPSAASRADRQLLEITTQENLAKCVNVKTVLAPYVEAVLSHQRIQQASLIDRSTLRFELCTFLLSHLDQLLDNARFSRQRGWSPHKPTQFLTPRTSFFTWVHTTGANSVSCPFSFACLICFTGSSCNRPGPCFESMPQRYLAQDLCGRLAAMSRLYNDYGSVARDIAEGNLNGLNFPEFHTSHATSDEVSTASQAALKAEMLEMAQHERECADTVLEKLVKELRRSIGTSWRVADAMTLFTGVSELYADIYVTRDLSNQVADV